MSNQNDPLPQKHFKAGTAFFVDVDFDAPLPRGACPVATIRGPLALLGSNTELNSTTFVTASSGPRDVALPPYSEDGPKHLRLGGTVPILAPPGPYQIIKIEIQWTVSDPTVADYVPVEAEIDHLPDRVIFVDPLNSPPQPQVPNITSLQ